MSGGKRIKASNARHRHESRVILSFALLPRCVLSLCFQFLTTLPQICTVSKHWHQTSEDPFSWFAFAFQFRKPPPPEVLEKFTARRGLASVIFGPMTGPGSRQCYDQLLTWTRLQSLTTPWFDKRPPSSLINLRFLWLT